VGAGGGGNAPAANAPEAASAVSSAALGGGIGGGLGLLALIALVALAVQSCRRKKEAVSRLKGVSNLEMATMAAVVGNPLAMHAPPAHQHHPYQSHPHQLPGGATEPPLPPGWKQESDAEGDVWYVNTVTGESVWDRPTSSAYGAGV